MKESVLSLKEKQHNIGCPPFKMPTNTNDLLLIDLLNII